jgi:hypothetical protein
MMPVCGGTYWLIPDLCPCSLGDMPGERDDVVEYFAVGNLLKVGDGSWGPSALGNDSL